jgi:NodT family efflux transporter outer membrane factor (OMF) lipoprotein
MWIGACAALLLTACARPLPTPPARVMAVPPPDQWTGGELSGDTLPTDWWVYFNDADLDRAIREALEGSHDLRAAAARIEAASADARIAGAALDPTLDLSLGRSQQRQNFIGFPIPGAPADTVFSTTSTNYGLRLNGSWEPDLWGRIQAAEDAAVTTVRMRYADLAAARLSLTGQVAKAWFAAVEAQRQFDLAQVSLQSFSLSADRVQARFEAGLRPSLDLRLALTEVARAEAAVEQRSEQLDRATRALEALIGRYPAGEYALSARLPEVPLDVPGSLPSELVHRRPDLVSAELNLLVSDARLAEAEANLRPRFSLTGSGGTASSDLLGLIDNDLLVWSFVGNLVQPLLNGGRLRATVDRNTSALDEALATYESRVLTSYREVESALAAEQVLARREAALEEAVRQSVAAESLAEERYRLGLTDIITVLSSQRTADTSESQLLSLRRARLDNRIDLHVALGGGFDMSDVPTSFELMAEAEAGAEE